MNQQAAVLYTAKVHTAGGRDGGTSCSSDGNLDVRFSPPGGHGPGTNPEQLFAAGWSACFESAVGIVARRKRVTLPTGFAIDAEVDLRLVDGFYSLGARLNVSMPGVAHDVAQTLVDEAHALCPYSRATRGNIDVATTLTV
jgi:lipoyl-dependent peroxiredoxin